MRIPALAKSPPIAAALSFVVPGLGQVAAGNRRRGFLVAVPALALVVAVVSLALFDRHFIVDALFSTSTLLSFLLLDAAILMYRLWAIVDAYMVAGRKPAGPRIGRIATSAVLGVVIVATLGTHLAFAALDVADSNLLASAFNPNGPGWFGDPNLAPGETAPAFTDPPGPTDGPAATDSPSSAASAGGSPSPDLAGLPTVAPTAGPTTGDGIPIFPIDANAPLNAPPASVCRRMVDANALDV